MRFWLTLILSTVILSAGLTTLTLYRGGQAVTNSALAAPPPTLTKPEMGFDLAPGQVQIANGIEATIPDIYPGDKPSVTIKCRNQGDGDLVLKLIRTQPPVIEVECNGQSLKTESFVLKPGQKGELTLHWQVDPKQVREQPQEGMRYKVEIDWNDHRFDEPLLIDILTRIQPRRR
jgi:hypothetical protein